MSTNIEIKQQKGYSTVLEKFGIVFILLGLSAVMAIMSAVFLNGAFYQTGNLLTIIKQVSVTGTLAYGVTLVIITSGIDLSGGSLIAFIGVVVASLLVNNVPLVLVILLAIALGIACGVISGSLVAFIRVPAFIATLGMMTMARGGAQLYSGGRPISSFSESFLFIGGGYIGPVPVVVIIYLILGGITHVLLSKTRFGKYLFAIGGNEDSAKLCGIHIERVKVLVYGYCGIMTALAAIMLTSRVNSGNPSTGVGYELDAIAASVIGGTSLAGGVGSILGTIVGALIIGVLNNGMGLFGISPYLQQIAKGIIIIVAVSIDTIRHREKK